MDPKPDPFKQIINLEKKMKNVKKQNESLLDIVKELKQEMQPRPSLPISVPFNLFQPKKITDKYTQTDLTIPEQFTVEEFEGGTRYSYILPKAIDENISKEVHNIALPDNNVSLRNEEKSQSATPVIDKDIEENIFHLNKKDDNLHDTTCTTADKTKTITNEITKLAQAMNTCDDKLATNNEGSDIRKQANIADDSRKTIDKNDVTLNVDKTVVGGNDALIDIFGSSVNYKVFVSKIYASIGKLYKSGIFSKNIRKLNTICILFDYIVVLCIEECECKKSNTEDYNTKKLNDNEVNNKDLNTKACNTNDLNTKVYNTKDSKTNDLNPKVLETKDSNTNDLNTNVCNTDKDCNTNDNIDNDQVNNPETCTEVPLKKKKNIISEIELHLQTMKQERNDDNDETEPDPDDIAANMEVETENEIESLQREIFNTGTQQQEQLQQQYKQQQQQPQQANQQQKPQQVNQQQKPQQVNQQQKPQQIKSIGYDPYLNIFMAQNPNSNSTMTDTRPPCPPTAVPPLPQTQTQTYTHNYYTTQESINKNYRHPFKRYNNNRPHTPYQRQQAINKVPPPQASHAQPPYTYPQYYQQNLQMPPHMQGMYPQNAPYH